MSAIQGQSVCADQDAASSTLRDVFYVLSTHWDREWYQHFQDYRWRLVELLDGVIEALEDGRLEGPFWTDGQSIVLEDYLEVRPHRREHVRRLLAEGRLVTGPWYVNPDTFLVSGESLLRNLEWGMRIAREWGGEPSKVGWLCDTFGHNSQMPQLFAMMGLSMAFIWRGVNDLDHAFYRWRGADGTQIPAYRFDGNGYSAFALAVRQAADHGRQRDEAALTQNLEQFLRAQMDRTPQGPLLLFDGGDHQGLDEAAYALIRARLGEPHNGLIFRHAGLDEFVAAALPHAQASQAVLEGELREPGLHPQTRDAQWLIPGVASSRVWIKQWNRRCETLLCHWAEPFAAMAQVLLGRPVDQPYLDLAWKWLLQNHPHDSICGCSIDAVHEDMRYRFRQCEVIAQRVTDQALEAMARAVEGDVAEGEQRVVVFNPLPHDLDEVVELVLPIPSDWPVFQEFFFFEDQPAFRVFGPDGAELPYQRLAQAMGRKKLRTHPTRFPQVRTTHDVTVALPLRLPAMGYTTLTLRRGEPDRSDPALVAPAARPTRHRATPGLATGPRSMANPYLSVSIEPNGTLTLTDQQTGRVYRDLLTFEDAADIGDGWYHGLAVNDERCLSCACAAQVSLVHDGPMQTTFRIRTAMHVPEAFDPATRRRSQRRVEMIVDTCLTLRAQARHLELDITVHNTAQDHRLRALFPSGAAGATTCWSDTPFDVVQRPIGLRPGYEAYRELEVETRPQQSWTAVCDGQAGLAVIADGLYEAAVMDLPDRPIALTLFRATGRTVFTDGEPGGQLQGPLRFRCWLTPLTGSVPAVELCRLGQRISAGLRAVAVDGASADADRNITLPATMSFLRVRGDAVLSSCRFFEDAIRLRLYNPTSSEATAQIESPLLPGKEAPVAVHLRPRQILSTTLGG